MQIEYRHRLKVDLQSLVDLVRDIAFRLFPNKSNLTEPNFVQYTEIYITEMINSIKDEYEWIHV